MKRFYTLTASTAHQKQPGKEMEGEGGDKRQAKQKEAMARGFEKD